MCFYSPAGWGGCCHVSWTTWGRHRIVVVEFVIGDLFSPPSARCYMNRVAAATRQPPPPHMEHKGPKQLSYWTWMPTLLSWGKKVWGNQVSSTSRALIIVLCNHPSVLQINVKLCCCSALTVRLLTRRFIGEYGDIRKCPVLLRSVRDKAQL